MRVKDSTPFKIKYFPMKLRLSKKFTFVGLITLLMLTSCTRSCSRFAGDSPRTPEEAVKRFVELSASAKDTREREKLAVLCSGELRRAFERMTDEAFRVAYLSNSVKVEEFKVVNSEIKDGTATIHYRVSIQNTQGNDTTTEVNEREMDLLSTGGVWLVDSIRMKGSDRIAFTRGMIF